MASPVGIERPTTNLPSLEPKAKPRVSFKEKVENIIIPENAENSTPFRKFRCVSEFRGKRKRVNSCSFGWDHINNKRRKAIIVPTKFLLGGNITDPLNLEALDKEETSCLEETASPNLRRGGTVQVIIPPNINDPLNLDACSDDGEEQLADAISKQRRRRKMRKRKRRNSEPLSGSHEPMGENRLSTSLEEPLLLSSSRLPSGSAVPGNSQPPSGVGPDHPPSSSGGVSALKELTSGNNLASAADTPYHPPLKRRSSEPPWPNRDKEKIVKSLQPLSIPKNNPPKRQRTKSDDKIVSPVIPQPGTERKRHGSYSRQNSSEKSSNSVSCSSAQSSVPKQPPPQSSSLNDSASSSQINAESIPSTSSDRQPIATPVKNPKTVFQYGNYNQYYGYRNIDQKPDSRLKIFDRKWFIGKQVLDIGCNIGHITLSLAKYFNPARVVGVDIDKKLINIAQKNVKHYLKNSSPPSQDDFPESMKTAYGALKPRVLDESQRNFPFNVKFYATNYVLESDALLDTVRPEFDVILCLSVTKWIHLNFGDVGLVRFFKRIYRNLLPGGMLILEPQGWPSYKKKKKLTNEIFQNYKAIRIYPNKFPELLTKEIGFSFGAKLSVQHFSKGFQRPVYIFKKIIYNSPPTVDAENISNISSPKYTNQDANNPCDSVIVLSESDKKRTCNLISGEMRTNVKCDNKQSVYTSASSDITPVVIEDNSNLISSKQSKDNATDSQTNIQITAKEKSKRVEKVNQSVSGATLSSCENPDKTDIEPQEIIQIEKSQEIEKLNNQSVSESILPCKKSDAIANDPETVQTEADKQDELNKTKEKKSDEAVTES